jgi:signal transduction histidine kinase/DNA-binding response OmpR family regulator
MSFLPNLNAARILVAESDPDAMDYATSILEEARYNVHKAYYAGDAVYAMEHGQFELALIDAQMRDRDQHTLTDQMPRFGRTRWIALVDERYSEPQRLLRQGAAALVHRPFRPDVLLRHVGNVLQGHAMSVPPGPTLLARRIDETQDNLSEILKRQLVEQQTLSKLARSLSAVLDLDVLLTQVVDAAVQLSSAEEGLLLLPDEEGKALWIRAVKGIDSETARNFRIKTQDTLAGQVFRTGKPILVGDQGLQKVKTEYLVKSLLYVPLSIKGQIIGVLGVNNKHADRTFSQHDGELLQDLAAHAAVAIENARLYEESVLRTRELGTLFQAGEAANSTLAIDQVLSIIAGQLIGALDASQCYISEWQPHRRELHTLAVSYRSLWRPTEGPVLSLKDHPAVEQAFSKKRMVVVSPPPRPTQASLAAWLPHHYQAQNAVYLPLMSQQQPIGVVTLYRLYAPYADQTTVQAMQLELHQLALEMVVTLAGSDARQQRATLFRITRRMLDTVHADWCEIALWNSAHHQFNVTLSYGEAIWREESKPCLELDQFPQLAQMLNDQTTFTSPPNDDLRFLSEIGHGKSLLGVPLVIKGETAGLVLLVDTLYDRRFSRREVELVQALVLQAANALDNARLYRDLELSLEELHRTQSKLIQAARLSAMGELAAAVAHQINNPLTTILGDTEMILQDLPTEDINHEALEAISRAGKRAHEVVRRLLTMARQQPTEGALEPLDVNETIHNTLMLVRSHIQHGNITVSILLDDDLPPVAGPQGQLEDVWLNLLLNARDAVAHRAEPEIGISTRYDREAEQVEVVVWDNGSGIQEELQSRVFEPFFTTKPAGEGTGLGLHICQQIAEKCNGTISLQSTYNEGTRFIIRLPVYHERE